LGDAIPFHKQLVRHDPANGRHGDCYRTALACLLGLRPDEVPHFADEAATKGQSFQRKAGEWLADRGLALVRQWYPGGIADLPGILCRVACENTGSYYLVTGRSPTGVNHVVIARNHRIVWDPHPDDVGLVGPCFDDPALGFLVEFLGVLGGAPALRRAA
jgi:hypothetical protein